MSDFPIIIRTSGLMSGEPCFRGTRVLQAVVDENLADGMSVDDLLDSHPTLDREDLEAYLANRPITFGAGNVFEERTAKADAITPTERAALADVDDEGSVAALVALHRGFIIAGYALVEFMLTDFLIRCSNIIDYGAAMPEILPYPIEKRLNCLRKVFTFPGPFLHYQPEIMPLIDKLLSFEDIRHMMSHGSMVFFYEKNDPNSSKIKFQRYDFGPKKSLVCVVMNVSLLEFEKKQYEVTRYSNEVVRMMWRILDESGLPPPPGAIDRAHL